MAHRPRYWDFFPWRWHILLLLRFKRRNDHISAPWPQIKNLFFTFESLRKQSILIFLIYGPGAEILGFFPVTMARTPPPEAQKTQWPFLGSWATNQKTNDTFFSSTFKVWESKVSLVFRFMAQGPRYWPFFPWRWDKRLLLRFKRSNCHISAPGPQIKKTKDTFFYSIFNVWESEESLFFQFMARGQDIGFFSLGDGTYSCAWLKILFCWIWQMEKL